MMRSNFILVTVLLIALVAAMLGLAAVGLIDLWDANQRIASSGRQDAGGERIAVQSDAVNTRPAADRDPAPLVEPSQVDGDPSALPQAPAGSADANPATLTSAASPPTPTPDGAALLQARCSACHLSAQLEQIEKPASEWDEILARMQGLGVPLSEPEKAALRDYLAVP